MLDSPLEAYPESGARPRPNGPGPASLAGRSVLLLGPVEPPVGGVTRYCLGLSALLRLAGAEVSTLDLEHVSAEHLPARPGWIERAILRHAGVQSLAVRGAVRSPSATVVIDNFQYFWRRARYAWCVALSTRVPYVLAIHHGRFPEIARGMSGVSRRLLVAALERIHGVIGMGEEISQAVRELAPRSRIHSLTPLLPPELVRPRSSEPVASPLPAGCERYLCFGGALGEIYGIDDILEAFPRLAHEHPDLGLVLLLGSFLREDCAVRRLRAFEREPCATRVVVLEDHPRGSDVIAGSAAYVRCSRADSHGLGLEEARMAGVPVVASRVSGRPEGVFLYPPGNVSELVTAVQRALSAQARERAGRLRENAVASARNNAARTLEFLRQAT